VNSKDIKCPHCHWKPKPGPHWHCLECGSDLDHFVNVGRCDHCGYSHDKTYCLEELGGCGQSSPHLDWYGSFDQDLAEIDIFNS
tara:strand:- start:838 stop:1089 length:252 start_codon:yes stop_codon:yes gene_type:complete